MTEGKETMKIRGKVLHKFRVETLPDGTQQQAMIFVTEYGTRHRVTAEGDLIKRMNSLNPGNHATVIIEGYYEVPPLKLDATQLYRRRKENVGL